MSTVSATASIVLGIFAMLGFGVADFIAKTILSNRNAIRTALVSQAMGTVLFLAVSLLYDPVLPNLTVVYLALISGFLSAGVLCSYYLALGLGKASVVAPIASCLNVVAILLAIWILGETLTAFQLLVITLVFVGILLVAFDRPGRKDSARKISIILALFAALLGGGNVIIQKLIAVGGHYLMGFLLTRIFMLGFILPLTPVIRDGRTMSVSRSYRKLGLLGLIDVSGFFCWYIGLRIGLVSIVTPIAMSSPAVTVVLAHIFLSERVRLHQRIGIVAIIAGIVVLSAIS